MGINWIIGELIQGKKDFAGKVQPGPRLHASASGRGQASWKAPGVSGVAGRKEILHGPNVAAQEGEATSENGLRHLK